MSGISIIILCTILAYMCLLIGVGAYNARKNSNSEDFLAEEKWERLSLQ